MFTKKKRNTCTCAYSKERNTDDVTIDNKNIFCKDGSKLLSHFLEYRSDFIYLYFLFFFLSGKKTTYQLIISVLRMQIQFNFHYFQQDLCFLKNCHFLSNNYTYK